MVLKKILAAGVTCSLLATMSLSAFSGLSVSGQTPKNGLGVKNLITKDGITSIEAEDYESLAGGKIMFDSAASGGTHIGDFYANCKAYYKINVADAGTYQITLKIATPQGGTVTVNTPSVEAEPVKFDATGGWQAYKDIVLNLWLNKGEQIISVDNLRLTWNFDKIEFKYLNDKQELSNIIKKANVYASSGNAEALKDYDKGKVWQAEKNDNQWITMRFNREFTINSIKLFDSAKTHIKSGNVIFSDGTSKQFGELSKDGTVISFENKNVTWLKIDSLKSSDTSENPALAEAEIMGIAKVDSTLGIDTALESFVKTNNEWKKMIDSLKEIEIKNNCIEFAWPGKYIINNVKLSGLQIGNNTKLTGKIEINDEEISFDENIQNGILDINFEDKTVEKMKITFTNLNINEIYKADMIQIFGKGTASLISKDKYERVFIENRWKGQKLAQKDGKVIYVNASDEEFNTSKSMWKIIEVNKKFAFQNLDSLQYMTLIDDNDTVEAKSFDTLDDSALWTFEEKSGFYRITNVKYPKRALHLEHQDKRPGEVLADDDETSQEWYSALWSFPVATIPTDHYYKITSNKIEGTTGVATSYVSNSITSNFGGSYKTWNLQKDISNQPMFVSKNSTITEAIYNLSMEEALLNIHDGKYGDVFWTGANWGGVWTRDVAMSIQYSLAWQFAEESKNSIKEKVVSDKENPGKDVIEQDTGTGGSYPCSVDKIIMALATWEQYLSSGDEEFLAYVYSLLENTIEQDYHVNYDKELKLFNGETGGLDHRSKTYPDWMDEIFEDSIINIADSKSSIVNIIYVEAMNVLSKSARILNKGEDRENYWKTQSEDLKKIVNDAFWLDDRGMYASFIYPSYMGSPVADKVDVISNGYALMYDIASTEQQQKIMENYPLVTYGAPTVWPQKSGRQAGTVYHNKGVWPGWEATLMIGAKEKGNLQLADEIWRSCIRNAGMSLTNKEVVDYVTGEGTYSDRQLWSLAGTLAGYYRILFGMEYEEDGIHFSPYVPEWLDGPFELNNYKYRDSVINFKLSGKGDTLVSIKVDGKEQSLDYIYNTSMTGTHTIEMVVEDSGNKSKINLAKNGWDICPEMPVLSLEGDLLKWTKDERYIYKIWNGSEYIDVSQQNTYKINTEIFGTYSLMAIDSNGISSELSKPIIVNSKDNLYFIEAEDGKYNSIKFASKITGFTGKGYVVDKASTSSAVEIEVDVKKSGEYLIRSRYNNQGDASGTNYCGIRSVYVDDIDFGTMIFPLSNHNFDYSNYVRAYLTKGKHKIKFIYDKENWYDRNMNVSRNDVSYDSFEIQYKNDGKTPDITELEKSYNYAVLKQTDGTLDKLINSAKEEFISKTENAKKALYSNLIFKSQKEIDDATQELIKSFELLKFEKADKSQLNEIIVFAKQIKENLNKYLLKGQEEFLLSLENAIKLFEDNEILKDDERIEKACTDLNDKISKLTLKPNKDALKELVENVKIKDLSIYTEDSIKTFESSLEKAIIVLNDENANELEIKTAQENLEKAILQLTIKEEITSQEDSSSSDDSQTSGENSSFENSNDENQSDENPNTGYYSFINPLIIFICAIGSILVLLSIKKKKTNKN